MNLLVLTHLLIHILIVQVNILQSCGTFELWVLWRSDRSMLLDESNKKPESGGILPEVTQSLQTGSVDRRATNYNKATSVDGRARHLDPN